MAKLKEILDGIEGMTEEQKNKILESKFDDYKPISEFDKVYNSLQNERKEHTATKDILKSFDGITPEEVKELKEKGEKKDLDLKDPSNISKLISEKLKPYETKLQEKENKLKEMQNKIDIADMERALRDVSKGKIVPQAETDLFFRAKAVLVKGEDGKFYASDGTALEDVAKKLMEDNPHWSPKGNGIGASGNDKLPAKVTTAEEAKAKYDEIMKKENPSPKEQMEALQYAKIMQTEEKK